MSLEMNYQKTAVGKILRRALVDEEKQKQSSEEIS